MSLSCLISNHAHEIQVELRLYRVSTLLNQNYNSREIYTNHSEIGYTVTLILLIIEY